MARDDRTYITVHDGMPEHPKVVGLTDRAFRSLVELWCYCSRNLSDGDVPQVIWERYTTGKVRQELLGVGLAEPREAGVYMHDYLEHQRSRAEVAALKEKRRSAGSLGGKARATALANAKASGTASAQADGKQTGSKLVAESETDSSSNEEEGRQDVDDLCVRLADRIEANGSKRPRITQKWRDEARRMIDLDGRDPARAANLIDWCQADPFWRAVVLSMPKFREKYDPIRLKATAEWEQRRGSGMSPSGDVDPDEVLGRDTWQPPPPPDDIEVGSVEYREWHRKQREQRHQERVDEARRVIERRRGA